MEKGSSVDESLLLDWLVDKPVIHFIDWCGEAWLIMDDASPQQVVLGAMRKQVEQASKQHSSAASASTPALRSLPRVPTLTSLGDGV